MLLWVLTTVVTVALVGLGLIIIPRLRRLRARGWCLSGLGVLANVLYAAVALYPGGKYDGESSVLVLAALPIGFIAQTAGAVLCVKAILVTPGLGDTLERLVLAGNLVVLLAALVAFVVLGDGFYLLAAVPGACLIAFAMFCVHYVLQRDEQRA
jgi:hypothetical protein